MTLFQKIIDKEIDAMIVYEDDDTLAFLDLAQLTPGHTLVVPKNATESYLSASEETLAHVAKTSQIVGQMLMEKLGATGINILSNANEIAGQTVFHYHVHVIPRYDASELTMTFTKHDEDINSTYEKIKG